MAIPRQWHDTLRLPVIAAPMFLVSRPDLVVGLCRSGVVGTFPSLNQRTSEGYEQWLLEIRARLDHKASQDGRASAPFGVNLIAHKSNTRLEADLALTAKHQVPLVITSLGAARSIVEAVHSYDGLVFHDVVNLRHARSAAEAGVDGLIAVSAGAGGHGGTLSPFAFVSEIRSFFDKTIVLAGSITNGAHVVAAQAMGADLAYMGTRFLATQESLAPPDYKAMVTGAKASDIVYTSGVSGVLANFLRPSLLAAGLDPEKLTFTGKIDIAGEIRIWRDLWSAGHGVGSIDDLPEVASLCTRLIGEYADAVRRLTV